MGFGPLGPTNPPGLVELDRLGSGSVDRPSPAPLTLPLSSSWTLANPKSPPPSPDHSGQLWWSPPPTLGAKPSPQLPLPPPPVGIDGGFLSGEICGWFPTGFRRRRSPPTRCLAEPSPVLAVQPLVVVKCVCGRRAAVLLVCCGEDYPGQPLAGRAGTALPCRLDEHPGDGEHDFSSFLFFSFFSGHGLWPSGQGQWAKLTDFVLWCC
jgi:hypothetical protein